MLDLHVSQTISTTDRIASLTAIIYDQYQIPLVENLLKQQIDLEQTLLLIKNGHGDYFLTLQVTQKAAVEAMEYRNMRRVIGLSDRIIGIELCGDVQALIQKLHAEMLYEKYSLEGSKKCSLNFVNSSNKKNYSRMNEGIFYHRKIEDMIASELLSETFIANHRSSSKNKNSQPTALLTVSQLLDIYNYCILMEKDSGKIKLALMRYKAIEAERKKVQLAEKMILDEMEDTKTKRFVKEIQQFKLPKNLTQKLEWKAKKICRYHELLKEDETNAGLIRMYKTSPIYDLPTEVINLQIKHFYRNWVASTLKKLKEAFKKIANRRDTKALNEFRQKCTQSLKKLQEVENSNQLQHKNILLVYKMKSQIRTFIQYHEAVMEGNFFSSLHFMRDQLIYLWRNQPKIFYRVTLFLLISYLAYLQNNPIVGLTIFCTGLIFSAINI